jgi:D-alanyl-D-alanine carboxypeptidase (penicillin-binding protein 5/6)
MSFYDLLEATMVVSADDASNMIAEVMGNGSIEKCVEDVNRYMSSLGLDSTHFKNPHGLHHPEHVTTAFDLAKLSQEAMKEPLFRKMASTPRFLRPKTNKQPSVHLQSTNRLLVKGTSAYYAPAIGIKTGYHRRAGHCLVAAAEQNGRSLIAVVLQSQTRDERFRDTTKLFSAAFQEAMTTTTYLARGPQTFSREIEGGAYPICTYTNEPISYSYYPSEAPETRCQLVWHEVSLPLRKGAPVGELLFHADGQMAQKVTLFAANGVDETFSHAITRRLCGPWALVGLVGLVFVGSFMFFTRRK